VRDGDRCDACPDGALDPPTEERVPVALTRCGVVAWARVPGRRCTRCGHVLVAPGVLARAHLSVACALADHGIQTGDVFRQMRKALGLRAADVATLLGVTPETISHWETGRATPARGAFAALAAMVHEAIEGRTSTRDRLAALAGAQPRPQAIEVRVPDRWQA